MVFSTVTMGITELSVFLTQIGWDLRRTEDPLRGIMCLLEGI